MLPALIACSEPVPPALEPLPAPSGLLIAAPDPVPLDSAAALHAVAPSPDATIAVASLLSSMHPRDHRASTGFVPADVVTVADAMHGAEVQSRGVVADPALDALGLGRGFDRWEVGGPELAVAFLEGVPTDERWFLFVQLDDAASAAPILEAAGDDVVVLTVALPDPNATLTPDGLVTPAFLNVPGAASGRVGHVDLAPALLAAMDVPIPSVFAGNRLLGPEGWRAPTEPLWFAEHDTLRGVYTADAGLVVDLATSESWGSKSLLDVLRAHLAVATGAPGREQLDPQAERALRMAR